MRTRLTIPTGKHTNQGASVFIGMFLFVAPLLHTTKLEAQSELHGTWQFIRVDGEFVSPQSEFELQQIDDIGLIELRPDGTLIFNDFVLGPGERDFPTLDAAFSTEYLYNFGKIEIVSYQVQGNSLILGSSVAYRDYNSDSAVWENVEQYEGELTVQFSVSGDRLTWIWPPDEDDDEDEVLEFVYYRSDFSIHLPANVQLPEVGAPSIGLSLDMLTFGIEVGSEVEQTLTISNPGTSVLSISEINVDGTDAGQFTASPLDLTVEPNSEAVVSITFAPTSVGEKNAQLILVHDAEGSPAEVALVGLPLEAEPVITIVSPKADDLWVVGETRRIDWESSGGDADVIVAYSADFGITYETIGTVPASEDSLRWTVPDELSLACRILIQTESGDDLATSEFFTIKDYELTRLDLDGGGGGLEAFQLDDHSWGDPNRSAWPMSWYQQFDYANGIDPITGEPYVVYKSDSSWEPDVFRAPDSTFTDWPVWVEAFGENQCYFPDASFLRTSRYRSAALRLWKVRSGEFKGACYGFALSSLMAFGLKPEFFEQNPIPEVGTIGALAMGDEHRKIIHKYHLPQWGAELQALYRDKFHMRPRETLAELKEMFLEEDGLTARVLVFYNYQNPKGGGHAVAPYRMVREAGEGQYKVLVNDSNFCDPPRGFKCPKGVDTPPLREAAAILIDSLNNQWTDNTVLEWGTGTHAMFLHSPIRDHLRPPTLDADGHAPKVVAQTSTQQLEYLELYNSPNSDILIADANGLTVGHADESTFNLVPGALEIIPITGSLHLPIGYSLPTGTYTMRMENFGDNSAYFTALTDEGTWTYSRTDAQSSQVDHLALNGGGLAACNHDEQSKFVDLQVISGDESSERTVSLRGVKLAQEDSLHLSLIEGEQLKVVNAGSSTSYDLQLRFASEDGTVLVEKLGVELAAGSSQQLMPQWRALQSEPVEVQIDLDMDGEPDETMMLGTRTAIEDEDATILPRYYALEQNYPNPFNASTQIAYRLPRGEHVALGIYDLLGRQVVELVNERQVAGRYVVMFDASDVASGMYFYRLKAGQFTESRKMLLIK